VTRPHLAGLRTHVVHDDSGIAGHRELHLVLHGEDVAKELGMITSCDLTEVSPHGAQQRRIVFEYAEYLTTVLTRGLQLGISFDTIQTLIAQVRTCVRDVELKASTPVIGFTVQEEFETLYADDDGGFVRVVEDEYTDRLTADELQELMDERQG